MLQIAAEQEMEIATPALAGLSISDITQTLNLVCFRNLTLNLMHGIRH